MNGTGTVAPWTNPKGRLTLGVCVALFALGLVIALVNRPEAKEPPSKDFYYTGPRFNRNTGKWVTAAGKIVPPPSSVTREQDAAMRDAAQQSNSLRDQ